MRPRHCQVCARPLRAGHHRLPQLPSGRVQRCVCPACGHPPPRPRSRGVHRGQAGAQHPKHGGSGSRSPAQPNPSRLAFSVFLGLPLHPRRALRGRGREQPRPGRPARVAGPPPPRRPGAPMGFSMTASGRGPPLFPLSRAVARLSPARRGFSRAQLEHGRAASPPPVFRAQARAAPSSGTQDHLRGAEHSPDCRSVPPVPAAKACGH